MKNARIKKCLDCGKELAGREGQKFCSPYCKSSYHYNQAKKLDQSKFKTIDRQLKLNRNILKQYNKAGKSVVRKANLLEEGFNPKYFTHYWKTKTNQVYLFCYEFGFLEKKENDKVKYVLVQWQDYMS